MKLYVIVVSQEEETGGEAAGVFFDEQAAKRASVDLETAGGPGAYADIQELELPGVRTEGEIFQALTASIFAATTILTEAHASGDAAKFAATQCYAGGVRKACETTRQLLGMKVD